MQDPWCAHSSSRPTRRHSSTDLPLAYGGQLGLAGTGAAANKSWAVAFVSQRSSRWPARRARSTPARGEGSPFDRGLAPSDQARSPTPTRSRCTAGSIPGSSDGTRHLPEEDRRERSIAASRSRPRTHAASRFVLIGDGGQAAGPSCAKQEGYFEHPTTNRAGPPSRHHAQPREPSVPPPGASAHRRRRLPDL